MSKAKIEYPVWLSTAEAARYLGIGERTLRLLAEAGEVAVYRIGRVFRYRLTDLDIYIAGVRVHPVPAVRLDWSPPQVRKITTNKERTA